MTILRSTALSLATILGLAVLPAATPVLLSLVYQNLGNVHLVQGLIGTEGLPAVHLEQTRFWQERALSVWEGNQRARWSLGYADLALGDKASAINQWRPITGLALDELLRLSDLAYRAGNYQEGLEWASLAVQLDSFSSSSLFRLGRAYQEVGEGEQALEIYKKALALAKFVEGDWLDLAAIHFARGETHAAQGNWRSAVAEFEAGLLLREDPEMYRTLGKIFHHGLGDLEGAERWLKKALALVPEDYWSMVYLGRLYIDAGRYEEAVMQLQSALFLGLDPESRSADLASGYEALAHAYSLWGRWAESIPHWRMAAFFAPTNPNAWIGLGDAYLAQGNHEQARAAYRKAAETDPQNQWLMERIETLR